MFQFYFLSILVNFFAGLVSASDFLGEKFQRIKGFKESFSTPGIKIFLGLLAFIIGIFKLIIPVRIAVVGDLIPAIAGIVLGITLMVDFYKSKSDMAPERPGTLQNIFVGQKSFIGMLGIIASILHFLFPRVIFL
ncbi:MAG: hypothetical protein E4H36_01395 [Spirochaetales bacterium]|nr:MAG: hypothetical protein E4H36_01395 [Spirochaetales bacterium]